MKIKKNIIIILSIFFLYNCSFDQSSRIWTGNEEKQKIQNKASVTNVKKISSHDQKIFDQEIDLNQKINLSNPLQNQSFLMWGSNVKNNVGHLYFEGSLSNIEKRKVGKNKFNFGKIHSTPIILESNIIFADDTGTIFNTKKSGQLVWKTNIYKKANKKFFKILSYLYHEGIIYVSDNIGNLYAVNFDEGNVMWRKSYNIPFKSHIKIFKKKIYLVDQNNKIICFDYIDGSKIWELDNSYSLIKSDNFSGLALTDDGYILFLNSLGDLSKITSKNGIIKWSVPTLENFTESSADSSSNSNIVIQKDSIIFSNKISKTYSINLDTGYVNWANDVNSNITPITDKNYIFILTENGYLVNIDNRNGAIIWSKDVLKGIKKKKRKKIVMNGFILGSDKIYMTSTNGYLIVSSANTGKVESMRKVAKSIDVGPIISNGNLYIVSNGSKILIFS